MKDYVFRYTARDGFRGRMDITADQYRAAWAEFSRRLTAFGERSAPASVTCSTVRETEIA